MISGPQVPFSVFAFLRALRDYLWPTPRARRLAILLGDELLLHADGRTGERCHPGDRTLHTRSGLSRNLLSEAKALLTNAGFIVRSNPGQGHADEYILTVPPGAIRSYRQDQSSGPGARTTWSGPQDQSSGPDGRTASGHDTCRSGHDTCRSGPDGSASSIPNSINQKGEEGALSPVLNGRNGDKPEAVWAAAMARGARAKGFLDRDDSVRRQLVFFLGRGATRAALAAAIADHAARHAATGVIKLSWHVFEPCLPDPCIEHRLSARRRAYDADEERRKTQARADARRRRDEAAVKTERAAMPSEERAAFDAQRKADVANLGRLGRDLNDASDSAPSGTDTKKG